MASSTPGEPSNKLADLYLWIVAASGFADRAEGFVSAILDYCDGLADFPLVGVARDDLRPGPRIVGFRRRVTIAFAIAEESVQILGIFYGGPRRRNAALL